MNHTCRYLLASITLSLTEKVYTAKASLSPTRFRFELKCSSYLTFRVFPNVRYAGVGVVGYFFIKKRKNCGCSENYCYLCRQKNLN